jgi:adenylylsulfate kinase
VKCPLEVCKERDPNGLYTKALRGEIREFTGVSSPYEEPQRPEMIIETDSQNVEEGTLYLLEKLRTEGIII